MEDINILTQRIEINDPELVQVKLDLTKIDDDAVVTVALLLQSNTSITELSLFGNASHVNITKVGWKALFEMLQINKIVRTLVIDGTNFDLECVQLFTTMVLISNNDNINTTSLTSLDLRNNRRIGTNGVYAIIDAILCSNPNGCPFTGLDFNAVMDQGSNNNEMKNSLAEKFVTLLQHTGSQLKILCLLNNSLGNDFVTIFAAGLKHNTQLETLSLHVNNITSVGAMALANALYYNGTLKFLELGNNDIGDDGVIAITTALRYHPTLEFVSIIENDVSDDILAQACTFLQYNESIKYLHLCHSECEVITVAIRLIVSTYNDTLYGGSFDTDRVMPLLMTNRRGTRRPPAKKGLRRRQDTYTWINNVWISSSPSNTCKTVIKKRSCPEP